LREKKDWKRKRKKRAKLHRKTPPYVKLPITRQKYWINLPRKMPVVGEAGGGGGNGGKRVLKSSAASPSSHSMKKW
jgi:hypothetical protein